MIDRKLAHIKSNHTLDGIFKNCHLLGSSYDLIGCDLRHLEELQKHLAEHGIDTTVPTLFIAECVLTYVDIESVNKLLRWISASFLHSTFCTYEQVHPDDAFGHIMLEHFKSQGCPLQNIRQYPTRVLHEERYKNLGWTLVVSSDMNHFYASLSPEEQERVNKLELFDEHEEWHTKCSHYMLLYAMKGTCKNLLPFLPQQNNGDTLTTIPLLVNSLNIETTENSCVLRRFGHSSVCMTNRTVIVTGGFGQTSSNSCHGRLDRTLLLSMNEQKLWSCRTLSTTGITPGKLIHHTTVALDNNTVLLYGGRLSPASANGCCYVLRVGDDSGEWEAVVISASPEPRWRHTATCISAGNGRQMVLITGGCSSTNPALNDCYLLDTKLWTFQKLDIVLSQGVHSHCAVEHQGSVILIGGLNSKLEPMNLCTKLYCKDEKWYTEDFVFTQPLPPSYGMAVAIKGNTVYLVGGVQFHQEAGTRSAVIILDLEKKIWQECKPQFIGIPPLLHGHTCHSIGESIFIFGGGGNCFSFGTSMNSNIFSFPAVDSP